MMMIKIFLFLEFMFDDDDDEAFVVLVIDVLMFFDIWTKSNNVVSIIFSKIHSGHVHNFYNFSWSMWWCSCNARNFVAEFAHFCVLLQKIREAQHRSFNVYGLGSKG